MLSQIALLILVAFNFAQAQAQTASEAHCKAVQTVEFRNSYLAAVYACPRALSVSDFNAFMHRHLSEISSANRQSLGFFKSRDGSRARFDHLDTVVMNRVALQAISEPSFCGEIASLKNKLTSETIAQAMSQRAPFALIRCGAY